MIPQAYEKVCLHDTIIVHDDTETEQSDEEVDGEALLLSDDDGTSLQRRFPGGNAAWLWLVNVALTVALSVVLILWGSSDRPQSSIQSVESTNGSAPGWIRPDKVYGYVHVAKTAGTQLNGLLASKYERVCGNKGYSYDFKAHNDIVKAVATEMNVSQVGNGGKSQELMWKQHGENLHPDRGIYELEEMQEIGWEDCDYITHEAKVPTWTAIADSLHVPLELHVSCRDPLEHIMSLFNFLGKKLDCTNPNLVGQVKKYVPSSTVQARLNQQLGSHPNITLKCFDAIPPTKYANYMGTILQKRRVEADYVPRSSNKSRNKTEECIWTQPEHVREKLRRQLKDVFFYTAFCDKCMGTEDELPVHLF